VSLGGSVEDFGVCLSGEDCLIKRGKNW
jgi:hypothetical protein